MSILNELEYKVYKNSDKEEDYKPEINKRVKLGTIDNFRKWILEESEKCGVLVYANDKEHAALTREPGVITVTEDMDHRNIQTMDAKIGPRFPVYLINKEYGGLALDFRAVNNSITLLIAGSFPDPTSRLQCLKRVGRYTDKCTRV